MSETVSESRPESTGESVPEVARWRSADRASVTGLLSGFGLELVDVPAGEPIPGSYWGDDEAGLIENRVYARPDTALHSILHESCHYICMDDERRSVLHTDAGGDYDEENAVCYLQILLAERIAGYGAEACMRDMDRWGYSFRLGSARAWFERDAGDARAGLVARGIDPTIPMTGVGGASGGRTAYRWGIGDRTRES